MTCIRLLVQVVIIGFYDPQVAEERDCTDVPVEDPNDVSHEHFSFMISSWLFVNRL